MGFTNYITQIKDTQSTPVTHDLVDTSASHYVLGTQTGSTNAWTGNLPDGVSNYYNGLAIDYFLPYAGTSTGATLNLGGKGAKPVYLGESNSQVTTHYGQYSVIHMTYLTTSGLNSGNGCWKVSAHRNSTYYYESCYVTTAAGTAAKDGTLSNYALQKGHLQVAIFNANTYAGAITLNINSTGAKPIYINGSASSSSNYTLPKGMYLVYYDGTNYYFRTDGKITGSITGDAATVNGKTVAVNVPSGAVFTDNNTTYTLSNALLGHKFTETLTAGGSGSGTSTATIELAAGTGITLTDDTSNKKITIASSVTNTDEKLKVAEVTSATQYYPLVGTGTTAVTRQYDTTGFKYKGTTGTTSAVGSSILELGNSTASGTAGNKQGQIILYGTNAKKATITLADPSADVALALPTSGGTLALTSHVHGNITSGGDITATAPTIASGDQLIINDNSASKITNGPTFDGSTTTSALTPKGTWEPFSKFSGSYNDLINKPTIPARKTWYGTCSSNDTAPTKVVTTTNSDFVLSTGNIIYVKFDNIDTYGEGLQLNVDETGAKSICLDGTSTNPYTSHMWKSGEVVPFIYDGTNYLFVKGGIASESAYGLTKLSSSTSSTSQSIAATSKAVKAAYDLAAIADAYVTTEGTNHIKIGNYHVCWGEVNISCTANTYTETQVTFPYTYTDTPFVFTAFAARNSAARTTMGANGGLALNKAYVGCVSTSTRSQTVIYVAIGE